MIGNLFSWVLSHLGEIAAALIAGAVIWFLLSRASAKWEKEEEQAEGSALGGLIKVIVWGLGILLVILVAGYVVLGGIQLFRHLSNQLCRTAPVLCPIQTVVNLTTTGESIAPTPQPNDPTPQPNQPTPRPEQPTPQHSGTVTYVVTYSGSEGLNCRTSYPDGAIVTMLRGDFQTTGELFPAPSYGGNAQVAKVILSDGRNCFARTQPFSRPK